MALDVPDGTWGGIAAFYSIIHIAREDMAQALGELRRVLRPGGIFAGTDTLDSEEFRELHIGDVCVPIDPDTLADRLLGAGFDEAIVDTNEYGVRFRAERATGRQVSARTRPA